MEKQQQLLMYILWKLASGMNCIWSKYSILQEKWFLFQFTVVRVTVSRKDSVSTSLWREALPPWLFSRYLKKTDHAGLMLWTAKNRLVQNMFQIDVFEIASLIVLHTRRYMSNLEEYHQESLNVSSSNICKTWLLYTSVVVLLLFICFSVDSTSLNDGGFRFIVNCIEAVESRGKRPKWFLSWFKHFHILIFS